MLDGRLLSAEFLPFADAARLRPLIRSAGPTDRLSVVVSAWLHTAHAWRWESPESNADALDLRIRAIGAPREGPDRDRVGGLWTTVWADCQLSSGEVLGRHDGGVVGVAALVLPDGRPIAVTGSDDGTVRVWDLNTGHRIGDPLTGHTDWVAAVAALMLPDGRPIAVTGSDDAHGAGVGPDHRPPRSATRSPATPAGGRGGGAGAARRPPVAVTGSYDDDGAGVGPDHRPPRSATPSPATPAG